VAGKSRRLFRVTTRWDRRGGITG